MFNLKIKLMIFDASKKVMNFHLTTHLKQTRLYLLLSYKYKYTPKTTTMPMTNALFVTIHRLINVIQSEKLSNPMIVCVDCVDLESLKKIR